MSELIRGRELAEKVLDHVTKHPERHYQGTWARDRENIFDDNPAYNECGTQACLAGWTVLLSSSMKQGKSAEALMAEVAKKLGLPSTMADWESVALRLLFPDFSSIWPPAQGTPEFEVQRAFYVIGSESYAIDIFADAFGLEIPEGYDDDE
jgi:hypothetical protein